MLSALRSAASAPALISTRNEYDSLATTYLTIAAVVFVIVVAAIVGAVLRYRHGREPSRRSESNLLEASYALFLAAIAGALIYLSLSAEHKVDTVANRERPSLTVDVTAAQWEWSFSYPTYGITAHSGVVGFQPLVVPADRAIRFELRSQDVIHSMWIPELEFKRDLIPGYTEHVTLTFTHTGTFSGQCAEFCGLYHPEMIFRVHVVTPSTFQGWLVTHRGGLT